MVRGMSANTIAENRRRRLDPARPVWLFGYGSLIFRADFPFRERRPAALHGWARRFWQGSHDHRGTPEAPGRVVTLVRVPDATCHGIAYLVAPETFEALDYREKNGYLRLEETLEFDDGSETHGIVYIATEDNAAWLGPASIDAIARHVAASVGPSGANRDYVLQLAAALRELGATDDHVAAIAAQLCER